MIIILLKFSPKYEFGDNHLPRVCGNGITLRRDEFWAGWPTEIELLIFPFPDCSITTKVIISVLGDTTTYVCMYKIPTYKGEGVKSDDTEPINIILYGVPIPIE